MIKEKLEAPPGTIDEERVRKVEILISTLLRAGVVASLCIVFLGMVVSYLHHHDYLYSRQALPLLTTSGAAFPRTVGQVLAAAWRLNGQAISLAGLLLLIATPVARVAVSVFAFVYQRDRAFVLITSLVLLLLLLSFVLGKGEA